MDAIKKSHAKLHAKVAKEVEGLPQFEALHAELLREYAACSQDWQRRVVNRKIDRNGLSATKSRGTL